MNTSTTSRVRVLPSFERGPLLKCQRFPDCMHLGIRRQRQKNIAIELS